MRSDSVDRPRPSYYLTCLLSGVNSYLRGMASCCPTPATNQLGRYDWTLPHTMSTSQSKLEGPVNMNAHLTLRIFVLAICETL